MPSPSLSRTQRLFGLLVLIGLVLLLSVALSQRLQQRHQPEAARTVPAPTVMVQTLESETFRLLRRYRGSIEAERQSQIAAQVSAQVLAIPRREGEVVGEGEVLIHLDDRALRQELERLLAVSERLQGELDVAEREWYRQQSLYAKQLVSERLLDESRQRVDILLAQQRENRAALTQLRLQLERTEERAPFAATISQVLVREGELVTPGRAMIELVATDELKAVLLLPMGDAALLLEGQRARVSVSDGRQWEGRVDRLYPTLDAQTRTGRFAVRLPEQSGLRPGMAVTAEVELGYHPEAVLIPAAALWRGEGESWVYLLEQGRAQRREVGVGARQEGRLWIEAGLRAGEVLILDADPRLHDGLVVEAREFAAR